MRRNTSQRIDQLNRVIFSVASVPMTENITPIYANQNNKLPITPSSQIDVQFIKMVMMNHLVFYNLEENERSCVLSQFKKGSIPGNSVVSEIGQVGSCFMIVTAGLLVVRKDGGYQKEIKTGEGFGDTALLYPRTRDVQVVAQQDTVVWYLHRENFKAAIEQTLALTFSQHRRLMEHIRMFSWMTTEQKDAVTAVLKVYHYEPEQIIVQEGDPGATLYLITEGQAVALKGDKVVKKLIRYDSFGELSLGYNTQRQMSIRAQADTTCLVLHRASLVQALGHKQTLEVTFKNFLRQSLNQNILFSKFPKELLNRIVDSVRLVSYNQNDIVLKKGVSGLQKIVIVIEGGIKGANSNAVVALRGDCLGEEFLMAENKSKCLEEDLITQGLVIVGEVSESQFFRAVSQKECDQILNFRSVPSTMVKTFVNFILQNYTKTNFRDLKMSLRLRQGQFGPVYAMTDEKNTRFAVKLYSKQLVEQYEVERFLQQEGDLLRALSHPFMVGMAGRIQSQHYLATVHEFIEGDECSLMLEKLGILTPKTSQFYAATIVSLLQYMNQNHTVLRDIKPQNFLIDQNGYLRFANFNTAKRLHEAKTCTLIGTPHYMAPQVFVGNGYNNMADLWSLGVCIYEFLCGVLPYGDSNSSPIAVYEEIMQGELKFPQIIIDDRSRQIIEQLISPEPSNRHGGSFQILKAHPWFSSIDWQSLIAKQVKPSDIPYLPAKKNWQQTSSQDTSLKDILGKIDNNSSFQGTYKFKWDNFGALVR